MGKKTKNPEIFIAIFTAMLSIFVLFLDMPLLLRIIFGVIALLLLVIIITEPIYRLKETLFFHRQVKVDKPVLLALYKRLGFTIEDIHSFLPGAKKDEGWFKIKAYSAEKNDQLCEILFEFKYWPKLKKVDFLLLKNLDIDPVDRNAVALIDIPNDISCYAKPSMLLYLLLDGVTRTNIQTLSDLTSSFSIEDDLIDARLPPKTTSNPERIELLIDTCRAIAKRLSDSWTFPKRLEETILKDESPSFRHSVIALFGKKYTNSNKDKKVIYNVLVKALKDSVLLNQIEAAKWLGDKGLAHIRKVLKDLSNLDSVHQTAVAEVLLKNQKPERLDLVRQLFESTKENSVRIKILEHFEENGIETLSEFLLSWLEVNDRALQLVVIRTLGACGDLKVLDDLYRKRKSSFRGKVRRALNRAISAIEARHGKLDTGGLSINEISEKEGLLSLDGRAGEGGELSKNSYSEKK